MADNTIGPFGIRSHFELAIEAADYHSIVPEMQRHMIVDGVDDPLRKRQALMRFTKVK
jgi:hypothetical protein